MAKKEILFIVQYPEHTSPSQRFRFELYKEVLANNDYNVTIWPFFNKQEHSIIYKEGFFLFKVVAFIKGYCRRTIQLFKLNKFYTILILREAAPIGPPIFEWLYIKLLKKKVVYDFDDAIWIPKISENNKIAELFKNGNRVKKICKWAHKVSCGNEYLCNYAKQYNKNVIFNPTCVDAENKHNQFANHDVKRVTIGWTGSFSTLIYFEAIIPVLEKLQLKYSFDVKIICNKKPSFKLTNLQYIEWSEENEVSELATCQIGVMPLTNDEWSEGKSGFKLIQYLALKIPAVSSPVGVNKKIIEHGINGYLCNTQEEWYQKIELLLLDIDLRKQMGEVGRKKIVANYSLQSNTKNFLQLIQ